MHTKTLAKPYLKKRETLDDIVVWDVDGHYIRDKVNREFTNFGQHYRFPFIPTHEFWIDKQHGADETKYFVDHMLVEWNLMRDGASYDEAIGKADSLEQLERLKKDFLLKLKQEIYSLFDAVPEEVYVKKLINVGGLDVVVINGKAVRDLYYIEFTEGGHHFVYDFVPVKEVWLDDDLSAGEREFVLLHELHERYLMAKGFDYDSAHRSSSIIEYKCRRNELDLDKCINEEVNKNVGIAISDHLR